MAIEIEHKFLLASNAWRNLVNHQIEYKQGYLAGDAHSSIRVRIADKQAWLNIKSATIGSKRHEYEYEIPVTDATEILINLCHKPLIEKTRHFVSYQGHVWEIDEFHGENQGLIVAEIELSSTNEEFARPDWLGVEVTHDVRYYNNNLTRLPYSSWKDTI